MDSGDRLLPALVSILQSRTAIALGSMASPPAPHFIGVLFDLQIHVDDKLLSLWLPGRGSVGCAVPGPRLPPCLLSRLAASSAPLLVARRQLDAQLLLNELNNFFSFVLH